jgi:hypothetical protein
MPPKPPSSPLPPLYQSWMRECLPGPIPGEPHATCHDCAMCPSAGEPEPSREAVWYSPATKCCTYLPRLWNFLVGPLLEDGSPEAAAGRTTVLARIDAGVAVTPLGLERDRIYHLLWGPIGEGFGRAERMRCPHYIEDGGLCGVWRWRESTCATWFCKHERGAVGKEFWERLHHALVICERAVSRWCVLELDPGERAIRALFPDLDDRNPRPLTAPEYDARPDPERHRLVWGDWAGRELEFYRRSGALARKLPWKRVLGLGGVEAETAVLLLRRSYARLTSTDLPSRLRLAQLNLDHEPDGGAVVATYSDLDPLRLPAEVMGILPLFDGRPTRTVLQAVRRNHPIAIHRSLLRQLVDFGVLAEAEE